VEAVAALAAQCSDADAVSKLTTVLFDVLNGSEGKLAVNSHKCSLLEALGRVSKCPVTGASVQPLCVQVQSNAKL